MTIKDIAKAAGVSQGTVSNVLNQKGNVSIEKILLVEKVAKELGYNINAKAKVLRQGDSKTIALILPNIESPEYIDIFMNVKSQAAEYGYTTNLFITNDIPAIEKDALMDIIALRIKGIIAVSCLKNTNKYYNQPGLKDTCTIFLERKKTDVDQFAGFDYYNSGVDIGNYTNKKGYKNVAIFTGDRSFSNNNDFINGVKSVIHKDVHYKVIDSHLNQISQTAFDLFAENNQPELIITSSSFLIDAVISAHSLGSLSKRPDLICLSTLRSYQNREVENYQLNYKLLGKKTCEKLVKHLENPKSSPPKEILLSSDGFKKQFITPLNVNRGKTLNVLFLDSPSSKALMKLTPFFKKHTGIEVNFHIFPLPEIYDVIKNMGDTGIYDVIRLDMSWLPWLAPKTLLPLHKVNANIDNVFSQFLPNLKENYSVVNDTVYALPFDPSVQMMFYRKDLFENAKYRRAFYEQTKDELDIPKSFEQYNKIARFFTKSYNEYSPTEFGATVTLGYPSSTACEWLPRVLSSNNIYNDKNRVDFRSKAALEALHNYMETSKYANISESQWWESAVNSFASGKAAMTIVYTNHAADIIHAQDSTVAGKIGYATVPGEKPLLGGGVLGISKNSKYPNEAYSFLNWACSESISSEITMMGGMSPCSNTYSNIEIIDLYPWLHSFTDNIKLGESKNVLSKSGEIINQRTFEHALGIAIKNAVIGTFSDKEALDYAANFLENSLQHIDK